MDKFSYNSYPDSAESSPRSRDVEFENPPPWEDHQQQSYKVKLMCSYGGKIQPRPHDNQLTYVNGDTKIMSVDRAIRFPALVSKLSAVCSGGDGGEISFKYQLPGEDLDALISVTNDDDLEHMMHEYDRLLRMSTKPARMRLFLFPSSPISSGFGSEGSTKSDRDTFHPIPSRPESEKSVTAPPNNADFLFGSEKVAPIPPSPVKVPQPVPEPVVLEPPPMFVDERMLQPEHGVNPAEIQRQIQEFQMIQIRDQEQQQQQQQMLHQNQLQQQHQQQEAINQNQLHQQHQQQEAIHQNQLHQQHQHQEAIHQNQLLQQQQQQEAMYRRKSEDESGRYFPPTYTQNPAPTTNPQPPIGYWQGNNNNNNIPGNIYTTTSQNLPEQQQQVYMIPAQSQAPGTVYQSVMRPTVQGNQGYYPPVQRLHHPDAYMEQQNQPGYNVVQQQPQYSGGPQVMTSVGPQVMSSLGPPMGLQEPYSQMGNPMYYTVAGEGMMVQPPPSQPQPQPQPQQQYQGMGQPVSGMTDLRTGPDGKVVVNMAAPKVSQSSDAV